MDHSVRKEIIYTVNDIVWHMMRGVFKTPCHGDNWHKCREELCPNRTRKPKHHLGCLDSLYRKFVFRIFHSRGGQMLCRLAPDSTEG
jgi:hypothetical protein